MSKKSVFKEFYESVLRSEFTESVLGESFTKIPQSARSVN
jgi:hypothetical protein